MRGSAASERTTAEAMASGAFSLWGASLSQASWSSGQLTRGWRSHWSAASTMEAKRELRRFSPASKRRTASAAVCQRMAWRLGGSAMYRSAAPTLPAARVCVGVAGACGS